MSRAFKPIARSEDLPTKGHFLENPDKVFGAGMSGTLVPAVGGHETFAPVPLPPPDIEVHAVAGHPGLGYLPPAWLDAMRRAAGRAESQT